MSTKQGKGVKVEPFEPEHPWERQPEEPDTSWDSFVTYRDMGPARRTIAGAGKVLGKSRQTLELMSSKWDWVARCAAHDAWVDRETKLAEIEGLRDMKRRHVELAMELQEAAALGLKKLIAAQKALNDDPDAEPLNPRAIRELAELGAKLERLTRGEPDAIAVARVESGPVQDYSRLSAEQLRTLIDLTRKASSDDTGSHGDDD